MIDHTWHESQSPASQSSLAIADRVARAKHARLNHAGGPDHEPVVLGNYELERLVGAGGMGQVFAARSLETGARVALKLLHRSSSTALLRLKQEFRVLADVEHHNLVKLEELVVPPEGEPFFTMELIDGVPFVEYVRGRTPRGQLPNQIRLRRTLRQLLEALEHLHLRGYVHRDLKPSNVLVANDGRVAVLDFGLVCGLFGQAGPVEHDAPHHPSPLEHSSLVVHADAAGDDIVVGTPAYMAPEQAQLGQAGPAADLYAVGVILYECLCGVRPFMGRPQQVLLAKIDESAPDPLVRVPRADKDLLELCRGMLARDPSQRPSASDALACLDNAPRTLGRAERFVGRLSELAQLDRALAVVRGQVPGQAHSVAMMLRGPSGQGKSALLQRWASQLDSESTLVLRGRCFERESIAYKGLDTVVDALSRHLRQLSERERAGLMPTHVGSLIRLFPVLEGIWPAPLEPSRSVGPAEQRGLALASLRELLRGIAVERPTVVMLDDFHWADTDSARLLRLVLDDPGGPPLLLVVAFREPPQPCEAAAELRALSQGRRVDVRELELGGLTWSEARELVLPSFGDDGRDSRLIARAKALVRDSGGNPLHLCELIRSQDLELDAELDLDVLIAGRVEALEPSLRQALAFIALANGPIARAVILAAGASSDDLEALIDAELVWLPELDDELIEVTHDRIREAVLGEFASETLPLLHLRLAVALAEHDTDAELIAEHFERSGQPLLALTYAERAARQAMGTLAFSRAVTWYQRCLDWLPTHADPERRAGLERSMAEACANSGRLVEAAHLLLAQARTQPALDAHALRAKAVEYLLKAGRLREGLDEVATVLRSVGLTYPTRGAQLHGAALFYRRGLARDLDNFLTRGELGVPEPERSGERALLRAQAGICATVSESLVAHQGLISLYFLCRWRRLAGELGDPLLFARALGMDAIVSSSLGDPERGRELLTVARQLSGEHVVNGLMLELSSASVEAFADNWGLAVARVEQALPKIGACSDLQWERRMAIDLLSWTSIEAGDYRSSITLTRRAMKVAVDVGDVKGVRASAGLLAWALVCAGELEEAQRVLEDARAYQRQLVADDSVDHFDLADVLRDFAWIRLLLRTERATEAVAVAEQLPAKLQRLGLWRLPSYRGTALALIGFANLHAQLREPTARRRWKLRSIARKLRGGTSHQRGNAALIDATLEQLDGKPARAAAALAEAETWFAGAGAMASLAAARYRRAALVAGEQREALLAKATEYFTAQQIRRPEGLISILAPAPLR
ncbi:serine/threonine-protein kinase [Enhygromyxa salina]|uniref:non-specific serine/threonine protein kinase n=1 Tax=Enhygromyxa salina TaxID=215803 RepID=A0A2S9XT05_9BACT|nr:serine/threonine-protein kinase [Enhygromyxa salina]PRP95998.1 Serine/threonine-protein kinase PknA [Enhygromyxa salina]